MNRKVDLFDSTYSHFEADVLARIRGKTFGEDFGQNSWTTAEEYRRWADWLDLHEGSRVLEGFEVADAGVTLPFPDHAFDAIVCVDSANHFADRLRVLKEWRRVLEPGGKALFTDPVVITGLVSSEELAERSSIGYFLFGPPGVNERLIEEAGLSLVRQEDATENAAVVSKRWHDARAEEHDALVRIEGEERYVSLQRFFSMVYRLTSERRLSRFAYLVQKREEA